MVFPSVPEIREMFWVGLAVGVDLENERDLAVDGDPVALYAGLPVATVWAADDFETFAEF